MLRREAKLLVVNVPYSNVQIIVLELKSKNDFSYL